MRRNLSVIAILSLLVSLAATGYGQGKISGELKKWHKVTLDFVGPTSSETATPNPFTDYRLDVMFKNGAQSFVVPGYFAADGNAANTSADSGNVWRVHFAPNATGEWTYRVSFRTGKNVAVGGTTGASAGFMDGATGAFQVGPTDKKGRDLRGKGLLQYVGKHHLRFAETGEYFLKCGADAPENFLAYADFDGDFKSDGQKDNLVKTWGPHVKDWRPGDPTWKDDKGKGIIGAINYLAAKGMNVFSFLTMNIEGDDRNVFPYTEYTERYRMDCSKLDQWAIVLEHGNNIGMYLHFKTSEAENQRLLDNGDTGPQRKLYYRELIARFGHNLALNWNLGEEIGSWGNHNGQNTAQKVAMAQYFADHDPYKHHIVIHNGENHFDLLGDASALTGFSLQTNRPDFQEVHDRTLDYITRSVKAGKPWVVACDEPGDATHALLTDDEDPAHDNARKNALWGNIMAGGAGVEWYFGYQHPHSDLTCQDYRSRDRMWDQCRIALNFFQAYQIPFWNMSAKDERSPSGDWILTGDGVTLAFLRTGGQCEIHLPSGAHAYGWFNPRTGDGMTALLDAGTVEGGAVTKFTAPDDQDWVLYLTKGALPQSSAPSAKPRDEGGPVAPQAFVFDFDATTAQAVFEEVDGVVAFEAEHYAKQSRTEIRKWYKTTADHTPDVQPDPDPNHAAGASGGAYLEILPDTRKDHSEKLITGRNFSNEPGQLGVLYYPVYFNNAGRYYVWIRICCTGSEDNGLHVGLDGKWPESGQRMQWVGQHGQWQWDSKQRTAEVHTGVRHQIWLDVEKPGLHTVMVSMREDGFEIDKILLTQQEKMPIPTDSGPAERVKQ